MAKSIPDYIFRWLAMQFIPGFREANAPKREPSSPKSSAGAGEADEPGRHPATIVLGNVTTVGTLRIKGRFG